jgi:hypothetical protein
MNLGNPVFNAMLSAEEREQLKDAVIYEKQTRTIQDIEHLANGEIIDPITYDVIRPDKDMGRLLIEAMDIPQNIVTKLKKIVKDKYADCEYIGATYCEYNKKYGSNPRLPVHYDKKDNNYCCLDYQFESNTFWPIIINNNEYILIDNQAVIFHPSTELHGRTNKIFEIDEIVHMFFFWFEMPSNG